MDFSFIYLLGRGVQVKIIFSLIIIFALAGSALGQDLDHYKFNENNELELVVHIMGEVQKPGEYRVSDKTDVAELLAKAGGPTEYSNLKSVVITRVQHGIDETGENKRIVPEKTVLKVNLEKYLKKHENTEVPKLIPGDIILVPRNSWHRWRHAFTIVRDVSVVATAYFLYLRSRK